ncbi:lysine histidine transporter-like 1 isoform X1 [Miscanthus floridulus]|uniref:lysine histidine transporter-like 1 isoform X1 n=2 Tax=Miscanthus floridulus TaxID=154761 RepID=UPI0034583B8C
MGCHVMDTALIARLPLFWPIDHHSQGRRRHGAGLVVDHHGVHAVADGGDGGDAMPVFDMIETVLVKKYWFRPEFRLRLVARTVYVALTMFVAITFPFFSELLSFFGGFAYAPTSYFLPCIMWLIIYKPRRFSLSWFTNWICIVIGVLLMVLSPIGGLRQIILKIKTYKFYQDYPGLSHN